MPITAAANRFLLLYGSQTGQAEAISQEIGDNTGKHDLVADIKCLSLTEKKFSLERETCVAFVVSTTGDGEPPDTALKFWRRLKKKTLPRDYLKNLRYTLLGLGDSNYSNFCNFGKSVDRRLEELGAIRFYDCGWADDAVGLETVVEPWMDGLFPAFKKHLLANRFSGVDDINVCNKMSNDSDNILAGHVTDICINSCVGELCNITTDITLNTDGPVTKKQETNIVKNNGIETVNAVSTIPSTAMDDRNSSNLDTRSVVSDTVRVVQLDSTENRNTEGSITEAHLIEGPLTMPAIPPKYIKLEYNHNISLDGNNLPIQNGQAFPSSSTPVCMVPITKSTVLTREDSIKTAIEITLDISESALQGYQPGDSIGVFCPNSKEEVNNLIKRLKLADSADVTCQLSVLEGTKKKKACIPAYIPSVVTIRTMLETCLDIRLPPKKAMLRCLVECTSDATQKRRLQELCSRQGADAYTKYIREPGLSLLDILTHFNSCLPSIESLVEHLPRLQPRPYSASSCGESHPGELSFLFNILRIPEGNGRCYQRPGISTGWLSSATRTLQKSTTIENSMAQLTINENIKIPIFGRTNQHFRPPDETSCPLIMIGPGTGVAPFIGFLDQRLYKKSLAKDNVFGDTWLFFGCRHKERDYLYRETLQSFVDDGILSKLNVTFSRDIQNDESLRYVQDSLRLNGKEIMSLLDTHNAHVYVCGDAHNMAKDVLNAFIDIVQQFKGLSTEEARQFITKLRESKRYHEDVWT